MGNRPLVGRLTAFGCYSIPSAKHTDGLKLVGRHVGKTKIRMREQESCCEDGGKYKAGQTTQLLKTLRDILMLRCVVSAHPDAFSAQLGRMGGPRRDFIG